MSTVAPRAPESLGGMPNGARMRTVDEQTVHAPLDVIFGLAADVERWPQLLPHYRYVRFRERTTVGGIVEMSANRPFGPLGWGWPTWWVSLMEIRPPASGQPAIRFRHIAGITTHMEVEWSFRPVASATHVTVLHLWDGPSWPFIGPIAARTVIGPVFVHGIASLTLAGLAYAATRSQTSF